LRVPVAIGDYLILDAVRDSGGTALAVSEEDIRIAQLEMGKLAGVYAAPEAAATWAATAAPRRPALGAAGVRGRLPDGAGPLVIISPSAMRTAWRFIAGNAR